MWSLGISVFLLLATITCGEETTIQPEESNEESFRNSRIVGGQVVSSREMFPYQVSLRWTDGNIPFCGAAILDIRNLVTTARCVVNNQGQLHAASAIQAVVGDLITTTPTNTTVVAPILHIFMHANFNFTSNQNNIAILRINNLTTSSYIDAVPRATIVPPPIGQILCSVSGWGTLFAGGPPSQSLRFAIVPIVPFAICQQIYPASLTADMLCAGAYRSGACSEDYGGPLVCTGGLTGLVSWGIGCGDIDFPMVYTSIPPFNGWINQQLALPTPSNGITIFLNSYILLFSIITYISAI